MAWSPLLPEPDGTVGQEDRAHLAGVYAGLDYVSGINTATRRASALRIMRPYMLVLPLPDSAIDSPDRALLGLAYSGSALVAADPAAQGSVQVTASAVATILASGTCSVSVNATGLMTTPPAVNTASVSITASASADVIETARPAAIVISAAAGGVKLAAATASTTVTCAAFGVLVSGALCSVNITAAAAEAGGLTVGQGVADVDVAVLADARGTTLASGSCTGPSLFATARGTSLGIANVGVVVQAFASGDDGVPDPTSGTASVTILCSASGTLITPSQPGARGPTSKTIDFKSIADYYNARLPRVASYEFSGGRRFYQRDAS